MAKEPQRRIPLLMLLFAPSMLIVAVVISMWFLPANQKFPVMVTAIAIGISLVVVRRIVFRKFKKKPKA